MSEEPAQHTENTTFRNKDNAIGKICTKERCGNFLQLSRVDLTQFHCPVTTDEASKAMFTMAGHFSIILNIHPYTLL